MKLEARLVTHPLYLFLFFPCIILCSLIRAYLDFTLKETVSHSFCLGSVLCSREPSANQILCTLHRDFPVAQTVKCLAYNAGDLGSIPGSGRSSGEGNGNPLQYSCLENPKDRGAWWAT